MKKLFFVLALLTSLTAWSQGIRLSDDQAFEQQIIESGLIHSPLPIDRENALEGSYPSKEVLASTPVSKDTLSIIFANETRKRAKGSPDDPDYATYGNHSVRFVPENGDLTGYNRMSFSVLPVCDGRRIVNLTLSMSNRGASDGLGGHLINLVNGEWNRCIWEIDEKARENVAGISFSATDRGKDMTMGDSTRFYICDIRFERVEKPEKVSGWEPDADRIIYSTTGYETAGGKTAIVNGQALKKVKNFKLVDAATGKAAFEGRIVFEKTSIGDYGVLDFSTFKKSGEYYLTCGKLSSKSFRIAESASLWTDSEWRVLNYIFGQRCGYDVPGIHSKCHTDLFSVHNGVKIPYSGGWHDAGDLSQQTLQTGDVTYSLMEAAIAVKDDNPALSARLMEEARWGLEFILKNRYGDGYRASSMGLLHWIDGKVDSYDDITTVRIQNFAFDNFLHSAYEAFAAMTIEDDPAYCEYLERVAQEDFAFAMEKFTKDGYDKFVQPYEHSYNTSPSQYRATVSWAASMLYKLTGKEEYAAIARENIKYTLDCQRTSPLDDKDGTCGFFYRDSTRRSIVHYIHQSREQVYMQALSLLCETQPQHSDYAEWAGAIKLYGEYVKGTMKYTQPYGMIPSGVYNDKEYTDTEGFFALHLFPPDNAQELFSIQLAEGEQIDGHHYIKRFPVWFNIFNGNTAIHLSQGKSAAICANFLNDDELRQIAMEQCYWTVGKNPFGQSLIFGEGDRFPYLNSFSSGDITGAMPVGIRSFENSDEPFWPQTNNACYKEVWVTSAGKWLSLVAELNKKAFDR